ncbi:MAG TPA: helix-turn-helix transcriptional regulator [Vicinamibacterales bacterium]|jgi:PadR family transcriptional regulator PadR
MGKGEFLGEFEQLVLLAVMRLEDDAYGMTVRREIEDRTGRDVTIGAVYATLDRLEQKALVRSKVGAPTHERGGRAKRCFVVTPSGVSAVEQTQLALKRMTSGLRFGNA